MTTCGPWLSACLVAVGLLTAAGCGRVADDQAAVTAGSGGSMGSRDAGSETTGSGGALDAAPDSHAAVCAPFRPEFGSGCMACPDQPKCCGWPLYGLLNRCPSGLCLKNLDCTPTICQEADADVVAFPKLLDTLRWCISEHPCKTDAECGSGRCVGEMDPGGGLCRLGQGESICRDGSDCVNGTCVMVGSGGVCADRSAGEWCNGDSDCASGWCLTLMKTTAGIDVGVCTSGDRGEPCVAATDCRTFSCVRTTQRFSQCFDGEPSEPCTKPSDCKDGNCVMRDPYGHCGPMP